MPSSRIAGGVEMTVGPRKAAVMRSEVDRDDVGSLGTTVVAADSGRPVITVGEDEEWVTDVGLTPSFEIEPACRRPDEGEERTAASVLPWRPKKDGLCKPLKMEPRLVGSGGCCGSSTARADGSMDGTID